MITKTAIALLTLYFFANSVSIPRTRPKSWLSRMDFHIDHIDCSINSEYISNFTCKMQELSQDRWSFVFWGYLIRPWNDIRAHATISYLYGTKNMQLFNRHEDICGYLSGKVPSIYLDLANDYLRKYSNINHKCPYVGEIYFIAERIKLNDFFVRNLLPSGKIQFNVNYTDGTTFVGKTLITISNTFSN